LWPQWSRSLGRELKVLGVAVLRFNANEGLFLAGGISFAIVVNLLPFIMLMLSLLGTYLYDDAEVLIHIRSYLAEVAPSLDASIMTTLMDVIENRQIVGVIGVAGLIWCSTWVFSSIRVSFDIVFRTGRRRGFFRGLALDILMIVLVGSLLLVSMLVSPVILYLQSYEGAVMDSIGASVQWTLKYVVPFVSSFGMFALIYFFLPTKSLRMKSIALGALFSSVLWETAKHLFSWYTGNLGAYSVFYGSMSTVAVGVFWVYYSVVILLVGAELTHLLDDSAPHGVAEPH